MLQDLIRIYKDLQETQCPSNSEVWCACHKLLTVETLLKWFGMQRKTQKRFDAPLWSWSFDLCWAVRRQDVAFGVGAHYRAGSNSERLRVSLQFVDYVWGESWSLTDVFWQSKVATEEEIVGKRTWRCIKVWPPWWFTFGGWLDPKIGKFWCWIIWIDDMLTWFDSDSWFRFYFLLRYSLGFLPFNLDSTLATKREAGRG